MAVSLKNMFWSVLSVLERRGDDNYYFLGAECKICRTDRFDFALKRLFRLYGGLEPVFYRLEDLAAGDDCPDFVVFKLRSAVSVPWNFPDMPEFHYDYILKKAFRRGRSLKACRASRKIICSCDFMSLYPSLIKV